MGQRVLVCGATGFIGRNILERLAERPDLDVTGVVHRTAPAGALTTHHGIRLVEADLTNKDDVARVLRGQEVLIQAAAVTTGSKDLITQPYIHVTDNAVMNSLLFRESLEQKLRHVVFFSCTLMYPSQLRPVREEDFTGEIFPKYFGAGWTKVYFERMCEFYGGLGPTRYTAIRHSNNYGPYDKYDLERSHVFGATVTKVMTAPEGGTVTVWGDGSEARDLLYVSDLVDLVERILERQQDPFVLINAGLGEAISVRDLVQKIITASGRSLTMTFDRTKPTVPFSVALNIEKARAIFGWSPRVSLDEGIRRTIAWYREHFLELSGAAAGAKTHKR